MSLEKKIKNQNFQTENFELTFLRQENKNLKKKFERLKVIFKFLEYFKLLNIYRKLKNTYLKFLSYKKKKNLKKIIKNTQILTKHAEKIKKEYENRN